MSTGLLQEPENALASESSQRLRSSMAATRVSVTWLGARKTLTPEQKEQAADTFGAAGKFLSANKKLLDTRHPAFKAVTSVKNRAVSYWKGVTLPFPEPGVRLMRQDQIDEFDAQMKEFQQDLTQAVESLNRVYDELKQAATERLGSLYNPSDYPGSLMGLFQIEYDFPSVEPPDYLQTLNPSLYQQQCARVAARFDQAVEMAERAFADELLKLISHLTERLSGEEDGKPKIFRDTAVTNLLEFFERFRQLNIRSNEELDDLVDQAQQAVRGVTPSRLRESDSLRQRITEGLSNVRSGLDSLLIDRPRRNILRRPK